MCLICVDLQRDKLTSREARRNLDEAYINLDRQHVESLLKLIWKKEDKELQECYEENYLDWNEDSYETD